MFSKGLLSARHSITFDVLEQPPSWASTSLAQRQPLDTPSAQDRNGRLRGAPRSHSLEGAFPPCVFTDFYSPSGSVVLPCGWVGDSHPDSGKRGAVSLARAGLCTRNFPLIICSPRPLCHRRAWTWSRSSPAGDRAHRGGFRHGCLLFP